MPVANAGPNAAVCLLSNTMQAVASVGVGTWTVASGPGNVLFNDYNSPTSNINVGITGFYTLIWTEDNGNGCTDQDTVVIQLTQIPTSAFTVDSIPCTGNISTVTYTGTGSSLCDFVWDWNGGNAYPGTGIGPHSVSWGSTPGTHSVGLTVSLNGCSSPQTLVALLNPLLLTSTITHTDILCHGQTNGTVSLTPAGGTAPYQFLWNNGSQQEDLSNVPDGVYSVVITDTNGCTITNGVTVIEPSPFIIGVTPSMSICYGQSASLNISATGGTQPYSYFWNGMPSASYISVNPDTTTTYTASAIDGNGCPGNVATVTVYVSPPLTVTLIQNTDSV
ncbi:MAG: hypothetical protein COZ59_02345, partial [Bacteroidetes bacterium CG_4_8_14_3_um_filter_31_14]